MSVIKNSLHQQIHFMTISLGTNGVVVAWVVVARVVVARVVVAWVVVARVVVAWIVVARDVVAWVVVARVQCI